MAARKSLEYYVADVFSDKSYKGNPLSVVFTNGNLELFEYENISREFGYSETSFIYYAQAQHALSIRSFTPTGFEADGAGHNLLGAVYAALFKGIDIFKEQSPDRFVIMKDAPIRLFVNDYNTKELPVIKMQQKAAVKGSSVPFELIANALGLTSDDLIVENIVPAIVKTEVAHAMVPIKNSGLLNTIKPNNKKLIEISKQYQFEGFYCFTLTGKKQGVIAEARFFNPLIGIDEDAATGTAAGPLAGFLFMNSFIKPDKEYQILQGVKLNQPSIIKVMVRENDVLVGGSSIITMEGKIYL
jgi:PhzF family phenazine biosynthesis protein